MFDNVKIRIKHDENFQIKEEYTKAYVNAYSQ